MIKPLCLVIWDDPRVVLLRSVFLVWERQQLLQKTFLRMILSNRPHRTLYFSSRRYWIPCTHLVRYPWVFLYYLETMAICVVLIYKKRNLDSRWYKMKYIWHDFTSKRSSFSQHQVSLYNTNTHKAEQAILLKWYLHHIWWLFSQSCASWQRAMLKVYSSNVIAWSHSEGEENLAALSVLRSTKMGNYRHCPGPTGCTAGQAYHPQKAYFLKS